jgi:hypothetical protein
MSTDPTGAAEMHVGSPAKEDARSHGRMAQPKAEQVAEQDTPALSALHRRPDLLHGMSDAPPSPQTPS